MRSYITVGLALFATVGPAVSLPVLSNFESQTFCCHTEPTEPVQHLARGLFSQLRHKLTKAPVPAHQSEEAPPVPANVEPAVKNVYMTQNPPGIEHMYRMYKMSQEIQAGIREGGTPKVINMLKAEEPASPQLSLIIEHLTPEYCQELLGHKDLPEYARVVISSAIERSELQKVPLEKGA
ncbi:hypothetical protein BC835DRAFT_1424045 [Cytidiella melzeri]|nr:hypothetical protein BC835DRAFT_1424045 [Cytidiella melzeri]